MWLIITLSLAILLNTSAQAAVWTDDFGNAELGKEWTAAVWDANAPPNWKVEDGILKGSWLHSDTAQMLFLDEYPSLDYTMQVKCRIDRVWQVSGYEGGAFIFRSSGPENNKITPFYVFGIVTSCAKFFIAHGGGNWRDAGIAQRWYIVGQWYTLKLVVKDNDFLGYVDDKPVCELRDDQFKGKFVGLVTGPQVDVSFDDFMITDRTDDVDFSKFDVSPSGMTLATTWGGMKVR